MERSKQVRAVVGTFTGWISTSDGREERRMILCAGCHSTLLYFSLLSCYSPPSYISAPPVWSLLSGPRSAARVRGKTQNENKWGVGKAPGQCACLCLSACVYLPSRVFTSLPPLAVSSCGRGKRPSRDSSSTCRWAPQGTDWALQAGILSIRPLQAAWETGDGATDSLCLLVYCWASVLWETAGFSGASAN